MIFNLILTRHYRKQTILQEPANRFPIKAVVPLGSVLRPLLSFYRSQYAIMSSLTIVKLPTKMSKDNQGKTVHETFPLNQASAKQASPNTEDVKLRINGPKTRGILEIYPLKRNDRTCLNLWNLNLGTCMQFNILQRFQSTAQHLILKTPLLCNFKLNMKSDTELRLSSSANCIGCTT